MSCAIDWHNAKGISPMRRWIYSPASQQAACEDFNARELLYVTTIDTTENFETNFQHISHEFLTVFS
jgi:hypothetical protein